MRQNEDLNGYWVVTEPRGAAQGQWAIAEKNGKRYFIKMFLSPKYPRPGSPGSEEIKERKRTACNAFEERHQTIRRAIPSDAEGGGNLVVTVDFFRVDSTYYKVTELVQSIDLPPLFELEPRQALTILRTLLFSIRLLHDARIVHSDLKPENVMYQETTPGVFVAKVIDFDEAYISGAPPERAEVVGDQRYYSPELLRYITGDDSVGSRDLTTASDIFSLGLLLHLAVTGDMPRFNKDLHQFACESVAAGSPLELAGVTGKLETLVARMLDGDYRKRPDIHQAVEVFSGLTAESLRELAHGELVMASTAPRSLIEREVRSASPGLKGTLGRSASPGRTRTEPDRHEAPTGETPGPSRLKGTMKPK